jgi:UDP-N-acetylmuramyl pentapeptide phosphotransferase/UDP-N-acetylglucosamine-1-phosphate transferase
MDGTRVANEVIAFTLAKEMSRHGSGRETVMIFAVIGCLIAGIAGVVKAVNMAQGVDVLLCLLGAIGAFGMALCVYFWKR